MLKVLQNLLFSSLLLGSLIFAQEWDIINSFYHPQLGSMGNSGIAYKDNIFASVLNPALLGHSDCMSFYWYNLVFENELNNTHINFTYPFPNFSLSFSFFSQYMNGIPITQFIDDRIRANGDFSASINQARFGIGNKINDFFIFKDFDCGYSLGLQQYSFDSQMDTFHRFGLLMSSYWLQNIYLGLTYDINQDKNYLGCGVNYKNTDYQLEADYSNNSFKLGINYDANKYLHLRTGVESRFYTFGIGLFYDKLYSPFDMNMGLYIDYTYQLPIADNIYNPISYFSISLQELEKMQTPLIYQYPGFTNQKKVAISGWGPKNSLIWAYVNEAPVEKAQTNQNGQWEIIIPLNSDINNVKTKSFSLLDNKSSNFSKTVQIVLDDKKPRLSFIGHVFNKTIKLYLQANEILRQDGARLTDENQKKEHIQFLNNSFSIEYPVSLIKKNFSLEAYDMAGNKSILNVNNAFMDFIRPEQDSLTTYKDELSFNGVADRLSQLTISNKTTGFYNVAKMRKIGQFEQIIPLQYGKNRIVFTNTLEDGEINYHFYIIRLFHYKDIDSENLDKLATIGVLDRSDHFNPLGRVSQKDIITWLTKFKEIVLPHSEDNREWINDAYQFALTNKWIEKRDDYQIITRKTAMEVIAQALSLDIYSSSKESTFFQNITLDNPYLKYVNYFVEHGFILPGDKQYVLTTFVTRQEFLQWMMRTGQLEILFEHYFNKEEILF
ncbi:MAG: hypothetical protein PHV30_02965 [Candidatus Margulisbacteria bacterium]|nr:hypothetical protein [Candidatus Margulisiibacteriota bacterium]